MLSLRERDLIGINQKTTGGIQIKLINVKLLVIITETVMLGGVERLKFIHLKEP